jgi:uncharacterized membrane protein YqiK
MEDRYADNTLEKIDDIYETMTTLLKNGGNRQEILGYLKDKLNINSLMIKSLGHIGKVVKKYFITNKSLIENKESFIKEVRNVVKEDKTWVGETEVSFVKDLSKECGINIVIKYDNNFIKENFIEDKNTIYLINP